MATEGESIIIIRGRCSMSHEMERFLFKNHYPTSGKPTYQKHTTYMYYEEEGQYRRDHKEHCKRIYSFIERKVKSSDHEPSFNSHKSS